MVSVDHSVLQDAHLHTDTVRAQATKCLHHLSSLSLYVFITLYDLKVFNVLQPPVALGSRSNCRTEIKHRDQGKQRGKATPNYPVLWPVLTTVVGVGTLLIQMWYTVFSIIIQEINMLYCFIESQEEEQIHTVIQRLQNCKLNPVKRKPHVSNDSTVFSVQQFMLI